MISIVKKLIPIAIKVRIKKLLSYVLPSAENNSQPQIADDTLAAVEFDKTGPVRILLVAQHASIWTAWRSVWRECKESPQIEVHVVLAPFIHPYGAEKIRIEMQQCLKDNGVPFFLSDFYNIDSFKPHVVMLQNPYDSTRPKEFSSNSLRKKGYRIGYIPYGLEMGGGQENIDWQFNLDFHHNAWRIFARSKRHKAMYAKYSKVGDSNVVITGHPKFDYQAEQLTKQLTFDDLKNKIAGRKVVLWTPHFSVALPATWSTYRIYGQAIIDEAQSRPDLFFIIRPHPLFCQSMIENDLWTSADEQLFREQCKTQNNLWLDEDPDYMPAFTLSDALMTDAGSFLLEFLPIGKPILYLHHPEGSGLNDDGELINCLYKAESVNEIIQFLNDIQAGVDSKKAERLLAIPEYLFGLDGNASKRICEHIVNAMLGGDEKNLLNAEPDELQKLSVDYWKNASNTFLAPSEYYSRKREVLQTILLDLPVIESAIDIGCGDGYFTKVIAEKAQVVEAYDVSKALIEQATSDSRTNGILNITFEVRELEEAYPSKTYDLISCMGVVSCILDEVKYYKLLDQLKLLSNQGGYILLTDTLSEIDERVVVGNDGYLAKYRSLDRYIKEITSRGFILIKTIDIKKLEGSTLINKLFLFKLKNDN